MKHVFGLDNELSVDEVSEVSGGRSFKLGCPIYTTLALGEEGGDGGWKDRPTTLAIGEEGGDEMTTLAMGEEGGDVE